MESNSKRQKVGHNKTIIACHIPAEAQEAEKKGLLKFLPFGKKGSAESTELEEPELLHEIDTGEEKHAVEPELELWLNDGRKVKSLEELGKSLKTMSGRVFEQHREKNDIADWVREILGEKQIAADLDKAKNKKEAAKIIENRLKQRKRDARKEEKTEEKGHSEIHEAIQKITTQAPKMHESPEGREKALQEMEAALDLEEERINRKRLELANKRYKLIKERGEIEKEKFERLLKHHKKGMKQQNAPEGAFEEPELEKEYGREKIEEMIKEARASLQQGNPAKAKGTVRELKTAIDYANVDPDEIKKLEYDILELEADLKLAMLA